MVEKKEYRSAIRSRKMIRQAFYELLKEKNFEKITVTDIVKRAEINRSTFYAHYPDVMGLIDEMQEEVLTFTEEYLRNMNFADLLQNPAPYLQLIVNMTQENEDLYRLLSDSNVAVKQMENMKTLLADRIISTVEVPSHYKNTFEFEFAVRFFLGGFIDLYRQWLKGEVDYSIDDIVREISKLIVLVYNEEEINEEV